MAKHEVPWVDFYVPEAGGEDFDLINDALVTLGNEVSLFTEGDGVSGSIRSTYSRATIEARINEAYRLREEGY